MPELPEVETIVRGLRAVLPRRHILLVRLGKTDFIDDPTALERELPGCRIAAVERHGKFIAIHLEKGDARPSLLVHLGMTGQLAVARPEQPVARHTHVILALDDGRELRYTDARRFGRMLLAATAADEAVLGKLGDDPLEITLASFRARLDGRRAMVKALLLDQHFLRGMGNIYTDEALWRARIHPKRHATRLSRDEARRLHSAMRKVLADAIRLRGSSISDYVDAAGQPGDYQRRHRVYDREGKGCFRCARKIRRIIVAGRSSYFCPRCQKTSKSKTRKSPLTPRSG